MKKWIILLLFCTYLFNFTEVKQLLQIPNLIEHYLVHKIKNKTTTLFSFVKMHYLDEQILDSDYRQDMKLPFKTVENALFTLNPLSLPAVFTFKIEIQKIIKEKIEIYSRALNFISNALDSIFRPPILM